MRLPDDTIAAIATPIGVGGIGVVRVSGSDVLRIANALFPSKTFEPNRAIHCWLPNNIDEAVATYFKSPVSYTGEDVLEISCHGSPLVVRKVLDMAIGLGARHAARGEFTKRAFLNGKIDLVQAESVMSLISSKTGTHSDLSSSQLRGGLSAKISEIKSACLGLLSEIQAQIDFPDDVGQGDRVGPKIDDILANIESLLSTSDYGKIVRNGITAVIAGKPNVGKSSLLNALLKEDRAIVTDVPGTTRDAIEECVSIGGVLVKLVDTAGIRIPKDAPERAGVELSKKLVQSADVVLLVFDASRRPDVQDNEIIDLVGNSPKIVVLNKSDLGGDADLSGVRVSALTGQGVNDLEKAIVDLVFGGSIPPADFVITSDRHADCLARAKEALQNARGTVRMGGQVDLVSIDVQEALAALGEMLGTEIGDDVLDRIFDQFCVGK